MPDEHGRRWRKGALLPLRGAGRANQAQRSTLSEASPTSAHGGAVQSARYTEVDGWTAVWRHERGNIRILRVRLSSDVPVELSTGGPHIPDLAEMRERFPEHVRLWDAIRREFWGNTFPEGRTG